MKITMILAGGLILAGCAGAKFSTLAPKKARNPQCIASSKMQISNIFEDGIIAQLCPAEFESYYKDAFDACTLHGTRVFLPVTAEQDNYVDDQKVTLPEDKCFAEDGVYIYSDEMAKQFQKIFEKAIENSTGEKVDFGDSKRRIRKLKIIKADS